MTHNTEISLLSSQNNMWPVTNFFINKYNNKHFSNNNNWFTNKINNNNLTITIRITIRIKILKRQDKEDKFSTFTEEIRILSTINHKLLDKLDNKDSSSLKVKVTTNKVKLTQKHTIITETTTITNKMEEQINNKEEAYSNREETKVNQEDTNRVIKEEINKTNS